MNLGFAFDYTMRSLGLDFSRTMDIFVKINTTSETATLYPKAPITIMPQGDFDDKTIYKHFDDALKAQNIYIKAKRVIFDMRNYNYNHPRGNEEYVDMIIHSYRIMETVMKADDRAIEDWIIVCAANEKIVGLASKYVKTYL